jgi:hypothetical protein
MVTKSRSLMTGKSTLPEKWSNLRVKHCPQVRCSSMIFLSVSIFFRIGQVRRSFTPVRYIPEWLPRLSYKPLARYGYNIAQEVLHEPIEFVRESIVSAFEVQISLKVYCLLAQRHCSAVTCSRELARDGETRRTRTRKGGRSDC